MLCAVNDSSNSSVNEVFGMVNWQKIVVITDLMNQ